MADSALGTSAQTPTRTPSAGAPAAPDFDTERQLAKLEDLSAAVISAAQDMTQTRHLLRMLLQYLETPAAYTDPERLAFCLEAIAEKVEEIEAYLEQYAQDCGIDPSSPAADRRLSAYLATPAPHHVAGGSR